MMEFASHRDYRAFAWAVTRERRYVRSPEQVQFLEAVLSTSVSRQETITTGSKLWRAQLGHALCPEDLGGGVVQELPAPLEVERMRPPSDRACEGRANPKGIPCLYLATHQQTAVAEVRPWIGSYVSIAQFVVKREARVINCTTDDHGSMFYSAEPEPEERERAVWRDIDKAFSRPVTSTDDKADYSPTQVIAEWFRERGLDGIAYGSSLGPGHNVALFDPEAAALTSCGLVEIRAVTLDFTFAANSYFATVGVPGDSGGA